MRRIKNIIFNNISLKALALILAIISWFYIIGELNRMALEEEMGIKGGFPYEVVAKMLPILVDLKGNVVNGYMINKDKITVDPRLCNVIGLKRLLDKVDFVKTVPIHVSEYTKVFTVRASLVSPARGIKLADRFVTVTIPIEKIEKEEKKE